MSKVWEPRDAEVDVTVANAPIESATHDITIRFNPSNQTIVKIDFDPEKFKTWEYLLAIQEQARLWTEHMRMVAMQMQAQQAMQNQMIAQGIMGKGGLLKG